MDMIMRVLLQAAITGDKWKPLSLLGLARIVYIQRFFHI
jgi:hypothetical protein